ncbi:hypothetical protein [Nocardioides sp.]|uniref:hypothetical protein n=1 Tax=Nocardioides sp. TaxID=35761 RepID=UPI00272412C9|nr:hypothetical protein [Nocardioides sp.]MDO9454475.1 hypothetical protein [Nocardioides sp.]
MVDDDSERPSLAAPQLFGRRRSKSSPAPAAEAPPPAAEPADEPTETPVFEDAGVATTEVVPAVAADPAPDPVETDVDDTAVLATPMAAPVVRRPRRVRRTRSAAAGDTGGGVDVVDPAVDHPTDPTGPADRADPAERAGSKPARPPRVPRDRSVPLLPGRPAAALTGVVAGLALVGFTWLGFQGCEAVRGTSSCGTGPGMAALVVIFVLTVVVGGFLLSFFAIPDPGSTSFLATGLTSVICLLFLVDVLDHWSMVLVIPAISAVTYLASWWVTTTYVDTD